MKKINEINISYVLTTLAFISLCFFSAYDAFLTLNWPIVSYIVFILFMLGVYALMHRRKKDLVCDLLPVLLLVRSLFYLIGILVNNYSIDLFYLELFNNLIYIIVYLLAKNYGDDAFKLEAIFVAFSLITDIQLLFSLFSGGIDDKNLIVSGIGHSNYAATFLLLMAVYFLFSKKNKLGMVGLGLSIFGLLLTQSFGAYVAFSIIIVYAMFYYRHSYKRYLKWYYTIPTVVAMVILCVVFRSYLLKIFEVITIKISYLLKGDITAFGSSRPELYAFSWRNICRNPIFGSILNIDYNLPATYRYQNYRTHNIFLESMLIYGLLGSLINIMIVVYLIYRLKKSGFGRKKFALISSLVAVFIHGLVEPNFFTYNFELFMFLFYGLLISESFKEDSYEGNNLSGGLGNEALSPNTGDEQAASTSL